MLLDCLPSSCHWHLCSTPLHWCRADIAHHVLVCQNQQCHWLWDFHHAAHEYWHRIFIYTTLFS